MVIRFPVRPFSSKAIWESDKSHQVFSNRRYWSNRTESKNIFLMKRNKAGNWWMNSSWQQPVAWSSWGLQGQWLSAGCVSLCFLLFFTTCFRVLCALVTMSSSYGPMDCSPPGFSVHGILQAKILEWVAISFSRGFSQPKSLALQVDFLPTEPPGKPPEL